MEGSWSTAVKGGEEEQRERIKGTEGVRGSKEETNIINNREVIQRRK